MKKIVTGVVTLVLIGGAYVLLTKPVVVDNVKTVTQVVEKTVEVETLENRIRQAQDAARSEIEASAQAAYDAKFEQEMKEVELQIISEYRAEIEQRETELEKEVGVY